MPRTRTIHRQYFDWGQIDPDYNGRVASSPYQGGYEHFENFITDSKGSAIYRPGFEHVLTYEDCGLLEFKGTNNRDFIVVLSPLKMRFVRFVGDKLEWLTTTTMVGDVVTSTIAELVTPYGIAECREITQGSRYSQLGDEMTIVHGNHPIYRLFLSPRGVFSFAPVVIEETPFADTPGEARLYAVTILALGGGRTRVYARGRPPSFFSVGNMLFLTGLDPQYESINNNAYLIAAVQEESSFDAYFVDIILDVVPLNLPPTTFRDSLSTRTYPRGTKGFIRQPPTEVGFPDNCLYYKGRLYYAGTQGKPRTIWASEVGKYDNLTTPETIRADSPFEITPTAFNSKITFLYAGQNSLVMGSSDRIQTLNAGGNRQAITSSSLTVIPTSTDGGAETMPITKDGYVFYIGTDRRNVYFFSYDLITETFNAQDLNSFSYDITQGRLSKLRRVNTREDLIYALTEDGNLLSCLFEKGEIIRTAWHKHQTEGEFRDIVTIRTGRGDEHLVALVKRGDQFQIERLTGHRPFSKRTDFFTDKGEAGDEFDFQRKIANELRKVNYLDGSVRYIDRRTETLTYANDSFQLLDNPLIMTDRGKTISFLDDEDNVLGRFLLEEISVITNAANVTSTDTTVTVLELPTVLTSTRWSLSFDSIPVTAYPDKTALTVVGDGGFVEKVSVADGMIKLASSYQSAVIGYAYRGFIRSFVPGITYRSDSVVLTDKRLHRIAFRVHDTVTFKFGRSVYELQSFLPKKEGLLNGMPSFVYSDTVAVDGKEDKTLDRKFTLLQDEPLPVTITAVIFDESF